MKLNCKFFLLVSLVTVCPDLCASAKPENRNGSGRSDSELTAIRDGFDQRVADMFAEQKEKSFRDYRVSGWNVVQRFAYPRIEFATVSLWFEQNVGEANQVLMEYGNYFLKNTKNVLHRDNFHWHSEMALRLIDFFGERGSKKAGLLTPETERTIMEAIWLYAKRRQQDQVGPNTKAEPDHEESLTWYIAESENHHAQSFCTLWHFSKLAKERPDFRDRTYDDGLKAFEHYQKWNEYLKIYFAERARKGIFIEMMSRDYNEKILKGMFNVYDFASDSEVKRLAGCYIDLYFAYWAEEQLDGISGGGKARIYSDISPSTSAYGYLFLGVGNEPRLQSLLLSAMTTSYRPPLVVIDIAHDVEGRGRYEVVQRAMGLADPAFQAPPVYHMPTNFGGVVRYSYCTPAFIIGTAISEARPFKDWAMISSQNRSQGIIFAGHAKAGILPQCEKPRNTRAYNAMWSVQKHGTMITQKLTNSVATGKTRVWFAGDGLGVPNTEKNWVFAEAKGACAALCVVDGAHGWKGNTKANGKWLYPDNEYSPIILEVDLKSNYDSFDAFRAQIVGNPVSFSGQILSYTSVYGDRFVFYANYTKPPEINGHPMNYAPEKVYDSPFIQSEWNSGVVTIQKGARTLTLDFNNPP